MYHATRKREREKEINGKESKTMYCLAIKRERGKREN